MTRAGGEMLRRPFEGREQPVIWLLSVQDDDNSQIQPKKWLTIEVCSLRWRDVILCTRYCTKDWIKSFSSFNLCVCVRERESACVHTSLCFVFKCGHTLNGLTHVCSHLLMSMLTSVSGFFFEFVIAPTPPAVMILCLWGCKCHS